MTETKALRVYVAGPYTKGDVALNVRKAIEAANELYDNGMFPYVPHLTHFWHLVQWRPYEDWLKLDLVWLRMSDAVLRLSGESSGADKEVEEAKRLGMPVFHRVSQAVTWSRQYSTSSYKSV